MVVACVAPIALVALGLPVAVSLLAGGWVGRLSSKSLWGPAAGAALGLIWVALSRCLGHESVPSLPNETGGHDTTMFTMLCGLFITLFMLFLVFGLLAAPYFYLCGVCLGLARHGYLLAPLWALLAGVFAAAGCDRPPGLILLLAGAYAGMVAILSPRRFPLWLALLTPASACLAALALGERGSDLILVSLAAPLLTVAAAVTHRGLRRGRSTGSPPEIVG